MPTHSQTRRLSIILAALFLVHAFAQFSPPFPGPPGIGGLPPPGGDTTFNQPTTNPGTNPTSTTGFTSYFPNSDKRYGFSYRVMPVASAENPTLIDTVSRVVAVDFIALRTASGSTTVDTPNCCATVDVDYSTVNGAGQVSDPRRVAMTPLAYVSALDLYLRIPFVFINVFFDVFYSDPY